MAEQRAQLLQPSIIPFGISASNRRLDEHRKNRTENPGCHIRSALFGKTCYSPNYCLVWPRKPSISFDRSPEKMSMIAQAEWRQKMGPGVPSKDSRGSARDLVRHYEEQGEDRYGMKLPWRPNLSLDKVKLMHMAERLGVSPQQFHFGAGRFQPPNISAAQWLTRDQTPRSAEPPASSTVDQSDMQTHGA